ncbi:MAG: hypothetical protein WB592_02005 [Acidimicrobiales bacterium]
MPEPSLRDSYRRRLGSNLLQGCAELSSRLGTARAGPALSSGSRAALAKG